MNRPSKSTINYAAKIAYQLMIMRGLSKVEVVGLPCHYFYSPTLNQHFILVTVGEEIVPVKVKKDWINLI